jgi:hypothetical protein
MSETSVIGDKSPAARNLACLPPARSSKTLHPRHIVGAGAAPRKVGTGSLFRHEVAKAGGAGMLARAEAVIDWLP